MPTHPPRSQPFRKQEILNKRIAELRHAIRHNYSEEKINKIASKVRDANLKLYKGKVEQFRYDRTSTDTYHPGVKAQRELDRWGSMSNEDIIKLYSDDA